MSPALLAVTPFAASLACGGATTSDLFGASGGASSSSGSSGSSSSSGSSGNTSTSSSSSSGGGGVDAGDGGTTPDVSVPPKDDGQVSCGRANGNDVYCSPGGVCCMERDANSVQYDKATCKANADACNGQTLLPIVCDDRDDCSGGAVCCGFRRNPGPPGLRYVATQCVAPAMCTLAQGGVRICDPNKRPDECPAGSSCEASTALRGFFVCQ